MVTVTLTLMALVALVAALLSLRDQSVYGGTAFLVERIVQLLPQTQCRQCGYPGCRPYAEAVVRGAVHIDACPPGGAALARRLASLLGRDLPPTTEAVSIPQTKTAIIREAECIGCTKCITACPVEAIVGAAQQMHTVITTSCTGCELCIAPCPVDCIDLVPAPTNTSLAGLQPFSPTIERQQPCIRCGECMAVCPSGLAPQRLSESLRGADYLAATRLGLDDCIECGHCSEVCPSRIPLLVQFQDGKRTVAALASQAEAARHAAARHSAREQRVRFPARRRAQAPDMLAEAPGPDSTAIAEELAAAVARARQRRTVHSSPTDADS